ncbi:hypothetical protein Golax_004304, partial [Gossypium laxum]|nr:hypothetical protein [Gossypium laxum]
MSHCRRLLRIPSSAHGGVQSHGVVVGCMGWDSGLLAEKKQEEKEEWMRDERVSERCKGRKGMVELLECLETEAIMGEDQGRDPMDYNRRAQIFDTSSKVFQALKSHQQHKPDRQNRNELQDVPFASTPTLVSPERSSSTNQKAAEIGMKSFQTLANDSQTCKTTAISNHSFNDRHNSAHQ